MLCIGYFTDEKKEKIIHTGRESRDSPWIPISIKVKFCLPIAYSLCLKLWSHSFLGLPNISLYFPKQKPLTLKTSYYFCSHDVKPESINQRYFFGQYCNDTQHSLFQLSYKTPCHSTVKLNIRMEGIKGSRWNAKIKSSMSVL